MFSLSAERPQHRTGVVCPQGWKRGCSGLCACPHLPPSGLGGALGPVFSASRQLFGVGLCLSLLSFHAPGLLVTVKPFGVPLQELTSVCQPTDCFIFSPILKSVLLKCFIQSLLVYLQFVQPSSLTPEHFVTPKETMVPF